MKLPLYIVEHILLIVQFADLKKRHPSSHTMTSNFGNFESWLRLLWQQYVFAAIHCDESSHAIWRVAFLREFPGITEKFLSSEAWFKAVSHSNSGSKLATRAVGRGFVTRERTNHYQGAYSSSQMVRGWAIVEEVAWVLYVLIVMNPSSLLFTTPTMNTNHAPTGRKDMKR